MDADHTLHTVDGIVLGEMAGNAAVGIFLYRKVTAHIARCAVVEGPVELNSTGYPRAEHTDEGGLYYMLLVEEIIACALVGGAVNSASELGENNYMNVLVLKVHRYVFLVNAVYSVYCRNDFVRIGITARSLVNAVFRKHRHLLCLGLKIGGEDETVHPYACKQLFH